MTYVHVHLQSHKMWGLPLVCYALLTGANPALNCSYIHNHITQTTTHDLFCYIRVYS